MSDDKKDEPPNVTDKSKSNLMTSASSSVIDNFAGWDDGIEGDDVPVSAGLIQGTLIKFTNDARWVTREGEELPAGLELAAVDVLRVVQKWKDQLPVETIILEPYQKFPDIEKMNEETPREEWVERFGKMCGPWQGQHILYLLNPKTMDKYTYPTGTTGGHIAIRELRDKIVWMRRYRGSNVYPVVTLSDTFFPTGYGGRQRPHFVIERWVRFGGEGGDVEALPAPTSSPSPASTEAPAAQTTSQSDLPLVQEPSLAEEMNDELPDDLKPPAQTVPKLAPARRNLKKSPPKPGKAAAGKKGTILDAG